jgi:hypothetical protein
VTSGNGTVRQSSESVELQESTAKFPRHLVCCKIPFRWLA